MSTFTPGQLVIKHIYDDSDTIPLHTVAKVVCCDDDETLELASYLTPLDARYTDAYKWKPYSPRIPQAKAIPCKPQ